MAKGRGFGKLTKGELVTTLFALQVGTILLEYSSQFDAENTVKVTNHFGDRIYVRFVNADDTKVFMGPEFCIWAWELEICKLWKVAA